MQRLLLKLQRHLLLQRPQSLQLVDRVLEINGAHQAVVSVESGADGELMRLHTMARYTF